MGAKTLAQDYIFLRVGESTEHIKGSTEHPRSKEQAKLNLNMYDSIRISLKRIKSASIFDISVVFSLFLLTFCEFWGCLGKYKHLNYNQ